MPPRADPGIINGDQNKGFDGRKFPNGVRGRAPIESLRNEVPMSCSFLVNTSWNLNTKFNTNWAILVIIFNFWNWQKHRIWNRTWRPPPSWIWKNWSRCLNFKCKHFADSDIGKREAICAPGGAVRPRSWNLFQNYQFGCVESTSNLLFTYRVKHFFKEEVLHR